MLLLLQKIPTATQALKHIPVSFQLQLDLFGFVLKFNLQLSFIIDAFSAYYQEGYVDKTLLANPKIPWVLSREDTLPVISY